MTEKIEKELYGLLITQGGKYGLLAPFPVKQLDEWLPLDTLTFLVCGEFGGKARHLLVRGDFVIDYGDEGRSVSIMTDILIEKGEI